MVKKINGMPVEFYENNSLKPLAANLIGCTVDTDNATYENGVYAFQKAYMLGQIENQKPDNIIAIGVVVLLSQNDDIRLIRINEEFLG
jgi:hypothetical protein